MCVSTVVILICLGSILFHGGLKYWVDFAGGLLIQIKFSNLSVSPKFEARLDAMGSKEAMFKPSEGKRVLDSC